ncbi:MAG: hypothetical protein K6E47_16065 [Lachnospiraceae bacterium]|nr:hypothetical protein [Lachnospiraceae bacterium]
MKHKIVRIKEILIGRILAAFMCIMILLTGCSNKHEELPISKDSYTLEAVDTPSDTEQPDDEAETVNGLVDVKKLDRYYVKWAVPMKEVRVQDEWIEMINRKLAADGYSFGMELVRIDSDLRTTEDYQEKMLISGADIVFTGSETIEDRFSEKAMIQGKYMNLTEKVESSPMYDLMPEVIWDAVRYKGDIYMLMPEISPVGIRLMLTADLSIESEVDRIYSGSILDLDKVVSQENKFYYGFRDFSFAPSFGYTYDMVRGTLISPEGKVVNPFEVQEITDWMRLVNKWYKEGKAKGYKSNTGDAGCRITLTESIESEVGQQKIIDSWIEPLCKHYINSTAILESSEHKDEAFELLEVFRTKHEYGNLLVYGTETADDLIKIKSQEKNLEVFGIDDGLLHPKDAYYIHYDTAEQRREFFEKNVKASPSLYFDLPLECTELAVIVQKYLADDYILFSDSFDEKLEQFKTEYTEAFDRILKDYK